MRQLQTEGFMHNRVRMVVASFLTKDLDVAWQVGARHFTKRLVDGDVACNQLNWQWVAGTGTDANPHRIFNPIRQSERFDPDGIYIRRHVAELRDVGTKYIRDPGDDIRTRCGDPSKIVDHHEAINEYRDRLRVSRSESPPSVPHALCPSPRLGWLSPLLIQFLEYRKECSAVWRPVVGPAPPSGYS